MFDAPHPIPPHPGTHVPDLSSLRLNQLRLLRSGWAEGDISGTIAKLKRLECSATPADFSPRIVVSDFLSVVALEQGAAVTLEHCLDLMPLLEDLWKVVLSLMFVTSQRTAYL